MKPRAYYNENDRQAAAWLRELVRCGFIADGDVDERSIEDVKPNELVGYAQCHFFAGIGGWSYALRLAGWPDDRPVWTGSCPCQPFSNAGKRKGTDDERHLWPVFAKLIDECKPTIVFGEQVASAAGRDWLAVVRADLESMGYAVGAADLCAAGVGAPHIRQRLYFGGTLADTGCGCVQRGYELGGGAGAQGTVESQTPQWERRRDEPGDGGAIDGLADADADRRNESLQSVSRQPPERTGGDSGLGGVEYSKSDGREPWGPESSGRSFTGGCRPSGVGYAVLNGPQRGVCGGKDTQRGMGHGSSRSDGPTGATYNEFWRHSDWLYCRDERWRPVRPGSFPLAHGIPARVVRLRGYGNAIVPQVAQAFIQAFDAAVKGGE